jgi:hypothetical protein
MDNKDQLNTLFVPDGISHIPDSLNDFLGIGDYPTCNARCNAIRRIFDTEMLAKISELAEAEEHSRYITDLREYINDQLEIIEMARTFKHRKDNGRLILTFIGAEVERLRRLLSGLLRGSYDRSGDEPDGDDIKAVYSQDEIEFSIDRLYEIAKFYELRLYMFLEDISSDEYCSEELRLRSYPYDDPW